MPLVAPQVVYRLSGRLPDMRPLRQRAKCAAAVSQRWDRLSATRVRHRLDPLAHDLLTRVSSDIGSNAPVFHMNGWSRGVGAVVKPICGMCTPAHLVCVGRRQTALTPGVIVSKNADHHARELGRMARPL